MTCLNHASFCLLTVAKRGACEPTRQLILLCTQLLGLVLQVRGAEKFPQALGFECLGPLFEVSQLGPCFTAKEEDGGDKRLVKLEYAGETDGIAQTDPV